MKRLLAVVAVLLCLAPSTAQAGMSFGGGAGVKGPATSTNGGVVTWNGTDGKTVANSNLAVSGDKLSIGEAFDPVGSLALVGSWATVNHVFDVVVVGTTGYVCDWAAGFRTFDLSDPSNPTPQDIVTFIGSGVKPHYVKVVGNYAYVTTYGEDDSHGSLHIIDVTDPANISIVGSVDFSSAHCREVFVTADGNTAYVVGYDIPLEIVDCTTKATPTVIGSYVTGTWSRGVFVSGNYAYIADRNAGLLIVDVSNPASTHLEGSLGSMDGIAVWVSGNTAYVANYGTGVAVIDVTDKAAPTLVTTITDAASAHGLQLVGATLYIANRESGFVVANVTTPAAPVTLFAVDTSNCYRAFALGSYLYIADFDAGLKVYPSTGSLPSSTTEVLDLGAPTGLHYTYRLEATTGALRLQSSSSTYDDILLAPTSGNVAIGWDGVPAAPLDVRYPGGSSANNIPLIRFGDQSYYFDMGRNETTGAAFWQGTQTGHNDIILAPDSGNVGIGVAAPAAKLDVAGGAKGTFASGVDWQIVRGGSDQDITALVLRNANGTACYLYPNAAGDGIVVSTTAP